MSENVLARFGVEGHGASLFIDPGMLPPPGGMLFIDCETDEKNNFVGVALCHDDKAVYYFSSITDELKELVSESKLVGHNIKADAKWLLSWGFRISPENLFGDTALMSYVISSTRDSHSLKELAKEIGIEYPTYKDIVGKGRAKKTLDKQPLELVANYCGMDVLSTCKLYNKYLREMNPLQKRILTMIELPCMRVLFEMEVQGVLVDQEKLTRLDSEFKERLVNLRMDLVKEAGKDFNPNSNQQTAEVLESKGLILPTTDKGNKKVDRPTLEPYKGVPIVDALLKHNVLEKLVSTYTEGLLELSTMPYVFTTYNQIVEDVNGNERGISTNRLSSSRPNLQQIPTRTEEGIKIRELFVPSKGKILIDADFSQIELRLLAHFSKDRLLLEAFRNGKDLHTETAKAIFRKTEVTDEERQIAKTFSFAILYGAQKEKIAKTIKTSVEEAEKLLNNYWQALPSVISWVNRVKYEARVKRGVFTLHKRWIPLPGITSMNKWEVMSWERKAVNYVIQGSAAEVLKMSLIKLWETGYKVLLTVHDEFLIECDKEEEKDKIKALLENIVTLDVPLIADIGTGRNWKEAKQ